jgi:NADH:ubiquinone reductase (H+-translocating)
VAAGGGAGMSAPTRVVIVGGGFAGFHAARTLARQLDDVEITLVNPTDYFLYLPLLPEVTAGILPAERVCVPLSVLGPKVRVVLGTVYWVDVDPRLVSLRDPEGTLITLPYDRLLLTVGSVNKLLPIPGVAEHAYVFRSVAEAQRLRDHVVSQLELAEAAPREERAARCTFVVVGAGYTGTEVAAQGQLLSRLVARRCPGLRDQPVRWLLVERSDRILPELDPRLSETASRVLAGRGVALRTGTTIEKATDEGVLLSDGEFVPTRSLIWCVGVRPDPLVTALGLPTVRGRLTVDEYLTVPGHPAIFACGDAAAVPDLTRPGEITAMTAQHAVRQGRRAARNLAASLGSGRRRRYRHHDLGFAVDLAGGQATANPAGIPVSGFAAKILTRAYHLAAIPANRVRIAGDWLLDAVLPRRVVRQGTGSREPVAAGRSTS